MNCRHQRRGRCLGFLLLLGGLSLGLLPTGASAALTFTPATGFEPAASGPRAMAIGDLNNDGKLDLVTGSTTGSVSVLLGKGHGSFGGATGYPAGGSPVSVAIGNLNNDGKPDLAVAIDGSDEVSVLLGSGSGSFGAVRRFDTGSGQASVAIADLDNDGMPDLVTANQGSGGVKVLLGSGDGSFGPATSFPTGTGPASVAIGDLNNDGLPDLAVANSDSGDASVLLGNGDGSFGLATNFATGGAPESVVIGDLNNDGRPDIATANALSGDVSVLLGAGDGSFGAATSFGSGSGPRSVAIGDLDGDNVPDLATANENSDDVSVLLGAGDGSFRAASSFAAGVRPSSVGIGDLNKDGVPDLASTNSSQIAVLLNAPTADSGPASLIFGSPTPVPRGTLSGPKRVTFTNNGSAPLVITGFAVSGPNAGDFTSGFDTCHAAIPPGESCAAEVRFAPRAQGARAATLTALTNASTNPEVALSGTGGPLPRGPRGPRGPAGRNARVTCLIRNRDAARVDVTCRVKLVGRRSARLRWRLTHHGHDVAHGIARARHGHALLRLSEHRRLRRGRYVLHIAGRRHGTVFVVR
jgi:hypothetical protein